MQTVCRIVFNAFSRTYLSKAGLSVKKEPIARLHSVPDGILEDRISDAQDVSVLN